MRVSDANNFHIVQNDVLTQLYKQVQISNQVLTNKTVNYPSDAPAWAVNILQDHRILAEVQQYQSNLTSANDWMTASESSMQGILGVLQRAQVLAEQMSTGTIQSQEYQTSAAEVQGIIEQIATMLNSELEGAHIFSGTLTQYAPSMLNIQMTGNGPGSATIAGIVLEGGTYRLQFSRDDAGEDSTFIISTGNTLGSNLGTPLDFDTWTISQEAEGDPDVGQIIYSAAGVSSIKDAVSNRVGETLSWTGDSDAGLQTYRTTGTVTVTGAGSVTIDGTSFSVTDAADLVQQVNANAGGDYFAWQDGSQSVKIISRDTAASPFALTSASGGVSLDQITTMEQLVDDINRGTHAQGVIQLTGVPAGSDTVTLDGNEWTWDTITAGQTVSTPEDYAKALANFISDNTDDYSATYTASGGTATVQVMARTVGSAGNVTLSENGTNTVTSGSLYGGMDATELNPLSSGVQAQDMAQLISDNGPGHAILASDYTYGTTHYIQFSRDAFGSDSIISSLGGDLGINLGYDFTSSNWVTTTLAGSSSGQVVVSRQGVSSASAAVSDRVGETLSWTGDSDAGSQTYRTTGTVTVTGAGSVTIDGTLYAVTDAADLVDQINASGSPDYFALLDGSQDVKIVSTGSAASPFAISLPVGAVSIDQETTMQQLLDDVNSGVQAVGNFHFSAVPGASDTISVGDQTWSMAEIFGGAANIPGSVDQVASGVAGWINQHSTEIEATTTSSGTGATVMLQGRATGGYANSITLSDTGAGISNTGALFGGVDGTDSAITGKLYSNGESDLRLSTTIHATVTDVSGDDITLQLKWYGDYGELHESEVRIQGDGDTNAVEVPGMGGLTLYKDGANFTEGAYFTMQVGHDQSNQEEVSINYSSQSQMAYNWSVSDLVGDMRNTSLMGQSAVAKPGNTGAGVINFAGSYTGQLPRDLDISVTEGGSVPGNPADSVTLRVSWTDDQGASHEENVTLSGLGLDNSVEIPGAEGIEIYLSKGATDTDHATFSSGDSYFGNIEKNSVSVMDSLVEWQYQLLYGDQLEAQHSSQETLEMLNDAVSNLLDSISEAGARQIRTETRELVLEEQDLFASGDLENLQEVNLTDAFLELKAMQTSYNASLKVVATMTDMSLVNILGS
jgi:flagellin-like hook-associated protein FlgL